MMGREGARVSIMTSSRRDEVIIMWSLCGCIFSGLLMSGIT